MLVSYGGHGVVLLDDGASRQCKFRRNVGRPFCGDRVLVANADDESLVVESVLPRRNRFVRADERQRQHTIAANLDQVPDLVRAGANIIGGCCGTTPEHLKKMRTALETRAPGLFGAIHGRIGVLQQGGRILPVLGVKAQSHAGR